MRIVIGAAAGNIGRYVVEQVLQAGAEAIALVRRPGSLPPALAAQAQELPLDLTDAAAVVQAAQGADALFWLVPPNMAAPDWQQWYQAVGAAGAAALRQNPQLRAVFVSSLGAGEAPGLSTVSYVGEVEEQLWATGNNLVALRPGYFMENFLDQASAIQAERVVRYPYADDHDIPFTSAQDIAAAAAYYLLSPDWAGQWTRNLMGPANLTLPQCAALIAEAWGQPVRYERQSPEALRQSLAGLPLPTQHELEALSRALGDPLGAYATPRTHEAATPTTFQQFVQARLLPQLQAAN